jgi:tRNA(Ile)-lysidine synthase
MEVTPRESLESIWPHQRWRDLKVVVGVSGGADSVALVRLLHQLMQEATNSGSLVVAHYNHCLRAQASDGDERFVRDLAEHLGLDCFVQRADDGHTFAMKGGVGSSTESEPTEKVLAAEVAAIATDSEEQWRKERYDFFYRIACSTGARYVALAHHADDRVETVLHHILRGTGISGLAALKPFRNLGDEVVIARPLLHCSRASLLKFLKDMGQPFREDHSNSNNRFTRNKIRNQLLPYLSDLGFTQHAAAILRLADQAREMDDWFNRIVDNIYEQTVLCDKGRVLLKVDQLTQQPQGVQRELMVRIWKKNAWPLRDMNAQSWKRVLELLTYSDNLPRTLHLPGTLEVTVAAGQLSIHAIK